MSHEEAIHETLDLHSERGMCRCDRCRAFRHLLRQLKRKANDRGAILTVKDGNIEAQ
jgi:hypothetical protein